MNFYLIKSFHCLDLFLPGQVAEDNKESKISLNSRRPTFFQSNKNVKLLKSSFEYLPPTQYRQPWLRSRQMQIPLITNQIKTEETETNLPTDPTTTNRKTTPPLKPKPHLIPRFPKTTPPNQQKRKRKKRKINRTN